MNATPSTHAPPFDAPRVASAGGAAYAQTREGRLVDHAADPSARTYATFVHIVPLIAHFVGTSVVGLGIIVALVMWRVRRETPFLDDHAKESLNFQISLMIYWLVAGVLIAVLVGVPLLFAVYVLGVVGAIRGAMFAHRGEFYRYPMCLRLIQ